MGAKVSKAKRPKRRWIGISIPPTISSKEQLLVELNSSCLSPFKAKLYDTHFCGTEGAVEACRSLGYKDAQGFAIICVLLKDYSEVRSCLEPGSDSQLTSISSSGKIKLVRERMGLPKPPRQ